MSTVMFKSVGAITRAFVTSNIITRKTQHQLCRLFCVQPKPKPRDVILFPGQGSQYVGMIPHLTKLPSGKRLFEIANEILGYDLLGICLNGPKAELDRTVHCQPAVFVASLAALEKYKEIQNIGQLEKESIVTAGFSVGEFASLVLSKALTFEDGVRLVDIRAKAMQRASDENPSGMVTITGVDEQEVEDLLKSVREILKEDVTIKIANYLYPRGFVLAGDRKAIDYLLKLPNGPKIIELSVSGAFHTALMKFAQPFLSDALDSMDVRLPEIEVYSNVTGKPYESVEDIKRLLPRQLVEPVQWHAIMRSICGSKYEQTFYEIGPGRQLTAILSKLNRSLVRKCKNIEI
ncbi:malonyl-CoA-acyl carrier protein transacylase, mitochondrial-like [Dendronephthya gigantea]|uniref:malonyl-CoA-acyl carrier protein transacylase, mitochondrial-like n=1 Tax=Dendronephthya gigantea TaxID=151771 RepID=UPI00106A6DCF|nr:malonyl-CoA-acyl carrier protein transacylase, mitochondrial-like [Dendronephthya gigantea]